MYIFFVGLPNYKSLILFAHAILRISRGTPWRRVKDFLTEFCVASKNPKKRKNIAEQDGLCNVPFKRLSSENRNILKHADGLYNVSFKKLPSKKLQNFKNSEDGLCNARFKKLSSEKPYDLKHKAHGLCTLPSKQSLKHAQDRKKCLIFAKIIDYMIIFDYSPVLYLRKKDKIVIKEGTITHTSGVPRLTSAWNRRVPISP